MEKWNKESYYNEKSILQRCYDVCPKISIEDIFELIDGAADLTENISDTQVQALFADAKRKKRKKARKRSMCLDQDFVDKDFLVKVWQDYSD